MFPGLLYAIPGAEVDPCGGDRPRRLSGKPARVLDAVERHSALGPLLRGEVFDLPTHVFEIGNRHVAGVPAVRHEHLAAGGCPPGIRQPEPQVPVGEHRQSLVETADAPHDVGPGHHARAATRYCIAANQQPGKVVGVRNRLVGPDLAPVLVEHDRGTVDEGGFGRPGGVELHSAAFGETRDRRRQGMPPIRRGPLQGPRCVPR